MGGRRLLTNARPAFAARLIIFQSDSSYPLLGIDFPELGLLDFLLGLGLVNTKIGLFCTTR